MIYKTVLILCLVSSLWATKVPDSMRRDFALKMHKGFCLQSEGLSTAAFYTFNEGYQEAMKAGISPKKLFAIGNLFTWYRKFGHYLKLFEATENNRITDEYWPDSRHSLGLFGSRIDRYEALEIAEISRDMIFGVSEIIGGLLGIAFIPELSAKWGCGTVLFDGTTRVLSGVNRLKTKNDIIAYETKLRMKEIEAAAQEEDR